MEMWRGFKGGKNMRILHMNAGAEDGEGKHILFHFSISFQLVK